MKHRARGHYIIFWGLVLLAPFLLLGCASETTDESGEKPIIEQVRPVKAYELKQADTRKVLSFPGTAKALQDAKISFRVSGPLVALDVDTGQFIKKGSIIARIDSRDFKLRINTLKARLSASRADYTETKRQLDRYKTLVSENAAAKATYDQIKAAFEKAEAQVKANTRELENAQNALADTSLYAPFSGFVHHQYAENNEMVQAGNPIISMVDLSAIEVKIAVPEDLMPAVDRFESYICRFSAVPGKTFDARFKQIGKQPNPSNRTYPLTLVIEKSENILIRPGMAAEVSITIREKNGKPVFAVPMAAVVNPSDRQSFVWLVDPDAERLKRKRVTIGSARSNGFIEISGDLKSGQLIAGAGAHTLTADQKIRVMKPTSETNIGNEL